MHLERTSHRQSYSTCFSLFLHLDAPISFLQEVVSTYVDGDEGILSLNEGDRCQVLGEVLCPTWACVCMCVCVCVCVCARARLLPCYLLVFQAPQFPYRCSRCSICLRDLDISTYGTRALMLAPIMQNYGFNSGSNCRLWLYCWLQSWNYGVKS